MADDKDVLKRSSAGMRLIAQMTLYNRGDTQRLEEFITQSYSDALLETQPVAERVTAQRDLLDAVGKLRLYQVLAVDKHKVVVLLQPQASADFYYVELAVEEDYPHRITQYHMQYMVEETAPGDNPDA